MLMFKIFGLSFDDITNYLKSNYYDIENESFDWDKEIFNPINSYNYNCHKVNIFQYLYILILLFLYYCILKI